MALTANDWASAAARLKCTVSIIRAVAQKESSGKGFYVTGALKQRFEPAVFKKRTGKTAANYAVAYAINPVEAMNSTSWGMFQIMGYNFKSAGYTSVEAMLADYKKGEQQQLNSFVLLILDWGLDDELRNKKYAAFATRYNGPKYAINNYDVDLEKFDKQFAANPLIENEAEKKKANNNVGLWVVASLGVLLLGAGSYIYFSGRWPSFWRSVQRSTKQLLPT